VEPNYIFNSRDIISVIKKLSKSDKDFQDISNLESKVDELKEIITDLNFCKKSINSLDSTEFKEKSLLADSKESKEELIKKADNTIEKINNILTIKNLVKNHPMLFDGLTPTKQKQLQEMLTKAPLLIEHMPELIDHSNKDRVGLINFLSKFSSEALVTIAGNADTLFSKKMNAFVKKSILVELNEAPKEKVVDLLEVICKHMDPKSEANDRCVFIDKLVLASKNAPDAFAKLSKLPAIPENKKAGVIKILTQASPENWESLISSKLQNTAYEPVGNFKEFYTKVPNKRNMAR
jgi:hypothetical protein